MSIRLVDAITLPTENQRVKKNKHQSVRSVYRSFGLSILLLLAAANATATGTVELAPTRTVVDALGRAVEIPADPERIVTAGSAVLKARG